jgi:hypothetical protein
MPGGPYASGSAEADNHCTDLALERGEIWGSLLDESGAARL